jgi:type II secretory pathway component PulJ
MYRREGERPEPMWNRRPSNAGFTLLEVIISVVLMVFIVLVAGGAMRLGYRSLASGQKKIDTLERVRTSVTIINAQIQSAAPLLTGGDGSKQVRFEGARDSLTLATNYSIWGGRRGHVVVEYRVAQDDGGRQSLHATESVAETGKQRETMLFRGYDNIYFQYSDTVEPGAEEKWTDEWTDPTKTPESVKIVLVVSHGSIAFVVPVRVQGPFTWAAPGRFLALASFSPILAGLPLKGGSITA